jgi:hypothetical protein
MNSAGRILIARLDTLGLALPVESLLEVRSAAIVHNPHAGTTSAELPLLDLWGRFRLTPQSPAAVDLVVQAGDRPCLMKVSRIEGLRPSGAGIFCQVPPLLRPRVCGSYHRLLLLEGEPMIWCEPDLWLKGNG